MCINIKSPYTRKIKTWRKNGVKFKEKYYLRKTGIWIFCLGLNPSQTFFDLIDQTNLNLCNYFLANKVLERDVKGYTLMNFSNVEITKRKSLNTKDFDGLEIKKINSVLKHSIKKKTKPVVFFYGRSSETKKLIKPSFDVCFKANINKLIEQEKLYITINSRKMNRGSKNEDFDRFTHPGDPGMGNDLGIRLVKNGDITDLY